MPNQKSTLPSGEISVRPATAHRFADVRQMLAPKNGSGLACWCLTYRISNAHIYTQSNFNHPPAAQNLHTSVEIYFD